MLTKKEQWLFFGGGGKTVKSGENEEKTSKWRDEELYVSGLTVVWSKAGQDGVRSVIKTFTMDSPVLQVKNNLSLCVGPGCLAVDSVIWALSWPTLPIVVADENLISNKNSKK